MENSISRAIALSFLLAAIASTVAAGLIWSRWRSNASVGQLRRSTFELRSLPITSPSTTRVETVNGASLVDTPVPSKQPTRTTRQVHSMGNLVLGLEYPFETDVSFSRPVVGGKVSSACGCMSVQTTQLNATTIRLSGTLRVGGTTGTQSKDIHVTAIYSDDFVPASDTVNRANEQATVTLQYSADLALRPSSTKFLVGSDQSSQVAIALESGLLNLNHLARPPELCGLWVSSSTWKNGILEAVLKPDAKSAESVPHYIRFFVEQNNQEKELSIPISVSKRSDFGPANAGIKLLPIDGNSLEGCLWLRGVRANDGLADVTLSVWDSHQKLLDLPDLRSCKVTSSGNLIRRFQLPSKSIEHHTKTEQLRLKIAVGGASCFVNLELGK